ncbi:S-adenosyl-L-methionine-dependent methyltransferase [Massariosphaeria phaeospora]|uniref:S-adenosyl-L-methionine-dependent methyltransferase n=1 Tax=Massariosphaeria phaeospora TaxID=100035 RepID=A0A7C8MPM4_9PLEO|nr:S-adenosyl-L-methionine-dependent methyltransferase [Massariosphaeria phaeospora]
MPRIPTSLLRSAGAIDALLPALLGPNRDLAAARNELRWLREHAGKVATTRSAKGATWSKGAILADLVRRRARGTPLQYLLGTEHFGDLEILVRPGVLIPRQETAASVTHLVRLMRNALQLPSELRVLDLCTGTGCIPLLFEREFRSTHHQVQLQLLGVDISVKAMKLACRNLKRMRRKEHGGVGNGVTGFLVADVLIDPFEDQNQPQPSLKFALNLVNKPFWDILISNPPYISPSGYWKTTSRSVRGYEPKLALVPPPSPEKNDTEQADAFYSRLLATARDVEAKIVLFEVADLGQALRIAKQARRFDIFDGIEIWRDQPNETDHEILDDFPVVGQGNGRSVFCWRGAGSAWLRKGLGEHDDATDAKRLFKSSYTDRSW